MVTLEQTINKVIGYNLVLVKDYLTNYEYCLDEAQYVISKVLDYNSKLRNSIVYGIDTTIYSINDSMVPMLIISVLKEH
jgi:hypothetical protein